MSLPSTPVTVVVLPAGLGGAFSVSQARHSARNAAASGVSVRSIGPSEVNLCSLHTWDASDTALGRVTAELDRLGLAGAVAELDANGLTVVEPDRVRAPTERMLERVLDLMERRNGVRPDMDSGATHTNVCFPTLYYFLFEDPLFEDWLLHPVVRALVDYLLGEQCVLHATTVFMKGPTNPPDLGLQLRLHSDQQMVPDPFPPYALIAGTTLLLTDYTKENGAFAFVPGSHRACRHPVAAEAEDRAVPVEAPAGSLLVHHGALWHGSFGGTEPGIRAGMAYAYRGCSSARSKVIASG